MITRLYRLHSLTQDDARDKFPYRAYPYTEFSCISQV